MPNERPQFLYDWRFAEIEGLLNARHILASSEALGILQMFNALAINNKYIDPIDMSNFDHAVGSSLIRSLWVPQMPINLIWLGDAIGISISVDLFASYWDDIWYPSSDDMIAFVSESHPIAYFSHEEMLYLYEMNSPDGRPQKPCQL